MISRVKLVNMIRALTHHIGKYQYTHIEKFNIRKVPSPEEVHESIGQEKPWLASVSLFHLHLTAKNQGERYYKTFETITIFINLLEQETQFIFKV